MTSRSLAIAILTLGVLAGCTKPNPELCCTSADDCASVGLSIAQPCASNLTCSSGHVCVAEACGSDSDCSGATPVCTDQFCVACDATKGCATPAAPVCELSTSTCGGCGSDADCAPYSATPHCGSAGACVACADNAECANPSPVCATDTGTCRACALDTECASQVCNIDTGNCVGSAEILYASPTGSDGDACTQAEPCSVTTAIANASVAQDIVRMLPGSYASALSLTSPKAVSIVATGVTDSVADTSTISPLANLSIRGLTGSIYIDCEGTFAVVTGTPKPAVEATLTLRQVALSSGVLAMACTFTARESMFTDNGVITDRGDSIITLDRISATFPSGPAASSPVLLNGARSTLVVTNSVFGNTSGEPAISNVSDGTNVAHISFNTFYDAPGACTSGDTDTYDSNLFFAPDVTGGAFLNQTNGACTFNYNSIHPDTVGSGQVAITGNNLSFDPHFVSAATGDFHLMSTSQAIDAADPAATDPDDYDGTLRPQGAHDDIGAFEYKP